MQSIIAIPEPKNPSPKIASILFQEKCKIEVYWWNETHQIIVNIQDNDSVWFLLGDANILETISLFMCCNPNQILLTDLLVYDDQTMNLCRLDDEVSLQHLYNCKWSDYSQDSMIFVCNAFVYKQVNTKRECQRLSVELSRKNWELRLDMNFEYGQQLHKIIQDEYDTCDISNE